MKHTLTVLVENRAGVLAKVAGLFSRRGYNIHSLAVGTTDREDISRMTIVVEGDNHVIEQVTKQLHKLVEVLKIKDITEDPHISRELLLLKVNAISGERQEIMQLVQVFRAKIVDISPKSFVIEATGDERKLQAIREAFKPFGILEVAKTGSIAMVRGER